ncbi:MAG: hypothetical protein P8179_24885 [Candidatus Thiodiazotropha sp.]|jgi:hypothetical protein
MSRNKKFGLNLAQCILAYLKENDSIGHSHYGYCGVGFVLVDGCIHYTHFDEWLTYTAGKRYEHGGKYEGIIKTFSSDKEFIDWLSKQTDDSLSGKETNDEWYIDNQRITKYRLQSLLERTNA